MKNFLLSIAIITGFAACNNTPKQDDSRDIQLLTDSTSYHNNFYSDTSSTVNNAAMPTIEPKTEQRIITVTKHIIYTPAKTVTPAPVYQPDVNTAPATTTLPSNNPVATSTTDNTVQTGNGTETSTEPVATTTQTEKKKGWSSAAKGAAIGAGAGAIGGAIIAKKKGLGAVVGGVVGAAGGYIIGKDMDKRKAGN